MSEKLSSFLISHFDGVRANGSFPAIRSLVFSRPDETAAHAGILHNGEDVILLNSVIEGSSFKPTGQVFTVESDPAFMTGALIPATDGVYLNALDYGEDVSPWRKVTGPDDVSEPFADYITEFNSEGPTLYALKTNENTIDVSRNDVVETFRMKAGGDKTAVNAFFYDFDDYEANSFLVDENRRILNTDKSEFTDFGSGNLGTVAQDFGINGVTKMFYGGLAGVYAATAAPSSVEHAVYKASFPTDVKTVTWLSDSTFNPVLNFPSNNYLNYGDYVTRLSGSIPKLRYNSEKTDALWNQVSGIVYLSGNSSLDEPKYLSDDFQQCVTLNDNQNRTRPFGGFVPKTNNASFLPPFATRTFELYSPDDGQGLSAMAEWRVPVSQGVYAAFDLRGTSYEYPNGTSTSGGFYAYAFGNAYDETEEDGAASAVVLSVGVNHIPQDYDGRWTFNFLEESVCGRMPQFKINGSVVELSGVGNDSEQLSVITAMPILSGDNLGVLLYHYKNSDVQIGYNWSKPDALIEININDLIGEDQISPNSLTVEDLMLLDNRSLYATLRNSSAGDICTIMADIQINSEVFQLSASPDSYNAGFESTPTFSRVDLSEGRRWSGYSVRGIVEYANSSTLIDFKTESVRTVALRSSSGEWSFPFHGLGNGKRYNCPTEVIDYANLYGGVSETQLAGLNRIVRNFAIDYDGAPCGYKFLGKQNHAYAVVDNCNVVYRLTDSGQVEAFSGPSSSNIVAFNTEIASYIPSYGFDETSDLNLDDFMLASIGASNAPLMTGVYVDYISPVVRPDSNSGHAYFYASVHDLSANVSENGSTGRAQITNHRYVLFDFSGVTLTTIESFEIEDDPEFYPLAPDTWSFMGDEPELPPKLVCADGLIVREDTRVSDPDSWTKMATLSPLFPSGAQASGKYITLSDGRVLTWNSKCYVYLIDPSTQTIVGRNVATQIGGASGIPSILALQSIGEGDDETIYAFVALDTDSQNSDTIDLTIYSSPYSATPSEWGFVKEADAPSVDLLTGGSIYLTVDGGPNGYVLAYSSSAGGIKTMRPRSGYIIAHGILNDTVGSLTVNGNVLNGVPGGFLATGGSGISSFTRRSDGGTDITLLSANAGAMRNAFLNYTTQDVSSYTLIDNGHEPAIIELSADGGGTISPYVKNVVYGSPDVYGISASEDPSSYGDVVFHSSDGIIYRLSSITYSTMDSVPREVYNGKYLLSGMTYGFPSKDEALSDYHGSIDEMHVSSFDIDLSSSNKTVFIDNLYNTLELADDFGQTYWIAIAQLDNRVSSVVEEEGRIQWTHYPQRYKLNEMYDKPFRFADLLNPGTPSAETILVGQDTLITYAAVPRADWNTTHLRKIAREQAHLDNACDIIGLNPDQTYVFKQIQTSPEDSALFLRSDHDLVLHNGWRHDIKYFGPCVQPYTMFNSRIQDAFVTALSKYGSDDLNFVLGTSQGFIHLINGHLFAKAMYTDPDDNTWILSGNCTYAGCHTVDDGTSIENRFLFTDGRRLFNAVEHSFGAKCEIDRAFALSRESINDIFRIGEGAYLICTNKGLYVSWPRPIVKDYLDDYMLSGLNNIVDASFSGLLAQHVSERHFTGSDMDIINHKIDRNFMPYPADFTRVSPVVTSRHVLDVDNDLVESIEVRLTDDQAASNSSNIFAAVKNQVLDNAATATRSYAPPGWYDRIVDINDANHVVDFSDVRYICRRWRSGVVEFYIYIPTTFTYYFNNVAGYSQSPYAGLALTRPNAGNLQLENNVNSLRTDLRLLISNSAYRLNTIYMAQIVGNSLPLKIYMDSTYCDSNRAGLFDSIVQPSVVRTLPVMVGRSKNNVNVLMNASEQICIDFAIYGTDAQAIHIMAR